MAPDGVISTVAGTGAAGFSGDGGPAAAAQLNTPQDVALDTDGRVYIADAGNVRIRRVELDGTITSVAGNGTTGTAGDGGPAVNAQFRFPTAVTASPDGSFYIGDSGFPARVRKVGTDGVIVSIMGEGDNFDFDMCLSDSIPAAQTCLFEFIEDLVWGPDDRLYVLEGLQLRRLDSDGLTRVVAGNLFVECFNEPGDGGPATAAGLCATSVAVSPEGRIFLADNQERVRVVEPSGVIGTFASGPCASGGIIIFRAFASAVPELAGSAFQSGFGCLEAVALAPDGSLLVTDPEALQVRRLSPVLPGYSATALAIASEDGGEVYIFDATGRHLVTRDALTGSIRFTFDYDSAGRLTAVTDGDGNATTIGRDGFGNPTAITGPFGQTTTLAVDSLGFLATVMNPAGETLDISHDPGGLLLSFADANGHATTFEYDGDGFLTRDENAAGGFLQFARGGGADSAEVTLTTSLGRQTTYGVMSREAGGQGRGTTTPAGLVTTTEREEDAEGKTTTTTLGPDGTLTTVIQSRDPRFPGSAILDSMEVQTPGGLISTVSASRAVALSDPNNPLTLVSQVDSLVVNERTFVNVFDALSRTLTATTPEGRASHGIVDSLGRVTAEVVPGVDTVRYSYDGPGRLSEITQGARRWRYTYDSQGRLDSVIDPLMRATRFAYDGADRVAQQVLPDGRVVEYAYDSTGNVTGVTPPGRPAHTFSFTPVDLTASYNPPVVAEGATPTSFDYNLDRQLTRVLRPDGDTVAFSYDGAGRPQSVTHRDGTLFYGYAANTGNLLSVTAGGEAMTFAYDGSLLTGVTWNGPVAGSVAAGYGDDFLVQNLSINGNVLAFFGYDADGLLTQAGNLVIERDQQNGRIDSTSLGVVTTGESYDSFGQWAIRTAAVSGNDVYRAVYTRDVLGRITELSEVIEGDSTVFAYAYDPAGRLVEVATDGVVSATFVYDDNGNRLSVTRPTGVETGTYDAQDRLLSYGTATYGYTRAGELRFKAEGNDTTLYHYDALGNLLDVTLPDSTQIEYLVDGFNRRVGKKVNGVLVQGFLYQDQLNPVAELDSGSNVVSRFVYGTRTNVPDYVIKNDTTYRVVSDHLGSVRLVVNTATGTVVQRMAYDEFGRELLNTNPGFQPFGFAGGVYGIRTAFVRFGVRDYEPQTGRWTLKDPIGFEGADADLYLYAFADPVNHNDPSGELAPWIAAAGIGALVGGGLDLVGQLIQNGGRLACVDWQSIGTAALSGAIVSGLAPTGFLLGRGGARAAQYGYSRSGGLINRGFRRFGWSGPKNGQDVLSWRVGARHFDIPGTGVAAGANTIRDGLASGVVGGVGNRVARGDAVDCGCQP